MDYWVQREIDNGNARRPGDDHGPYTVDIPPTTVGTVGSLVTLMLLTILKTVTQMLTLMLLGVPIPTVPMMTLIPPVPMMSLPLIPPVPMMSIPLIPRVPMMSIPLIPPSRPGVFPSQLPLQLKETRLNLLMITTIGATGGLIKQIHIKQLIKQIHIKIEFAFWLHLCMLVHLCKLIHVKMMSSV